MTGSQASDLSHCINGTCLRFVSQKDSITSAMLQGHKLQRDRSEQSWKAQELNAKFLFANIKNDQFIQAGLHKWTHCHLNRKDFHLQHGQDNETSRNLLYPFTTVQFRSLENNPKTVGLSGSRNKKLGQ